MKFSDATGKLHCGAGFNTGQKQKTLSVPGRLWSMYIRAVEWNLTTGLLTVHVCTCTRTVARVNKRVRLPGECSEELRWIVGSVQMQGLQACTHVL
jgi:hypothetical protein